MREILHCYLCLCIHVCTCAGVLTYAYTCGDQKPTLVSTLTLHLICLSVCLSDYGGLSLNLEFTVSARLSDIEPQDAPDPAFPASGLQVHVHAVIQTQIAMLIQQALYPPSPTSHSQPAVPYFK